MSLVWWEEKERASRKSWLCTRVSSRTVASADGPAKLDGFDAPEFRWCTAAILTLFPSRPRKFPTVLISSNLRLFFNLVESRIQVGCCVENERRKDQ